MKHFFTLLLLLLGLRVSAQTGVAVPELAHCDAAVQQFVQRWNIRGASVAISKDGRLVYARGFGYADQDRALPMQPHHLLRVASLSKPVTAVAIMKLVEEGRLSLAHKVFGPQGYLRGAYYAGAIRDARLYDITVAHLLEHTAGWDRTIGCDGFAGCDPIDFPLHVARAMRARNPVADSTLIRFLLSRGLNHAPGTHYAYGNVGYLILGKLIEQVTGQGYETWVTDHLLRPSGVLEAHLARNLPLDQQEREGQYETLHRMPSCYGTGQRVPESYGGVNVEAMNAHGGWLFSARDLLRLLAAIDGAGSGLLSAASLAALTTPSVVNPHYAKGWMVDGQARWHSGSLDGTASYLARTRGGYAWAILLNSRPNTPAFWRDLSRLGWTCVQGATRWPGHDLFAPSQNATSFGATQPDSATTKLSWHNGNGTHRLVLVRADAPVDAFPEDGTRYAAAADFGQGEELGRGNFVVANGTASAAALRHLDPTRLYYARVVEYRQDATTNYQPVYTLEGNPTLLLHGEAAQHAPLGPEWAMYPNPVVSELAIQGLRRALPYAVLNTQGKPVLSGVLVPGQRLGVATLAPGLYVLRLHTPGHAVVRRFVKN